MTVKMTCEKDLFYKDNWNRLLLLLLLFSFGVSLYCSWLNYFYDIDEPKYARAVYEMITSGNYLAPMFDGVPRMQKPPLTYWVMVPFMWIQKGVPCPGLDLFFVRLAGVFCSVAVVLGTAKLGKQMFSEKAGIIAGLIIQSAVVFKFLSAMMKVDIVFACCTIWATYFYYKKYSGDKSLSTFLGAALFTGAGVLAKGPFAFLPLVGFFFASFYVYDFEGDKSFVSLFKGRRVASWLKRDGGTILSWVVLGCVPFFIWLYVTYEVTALNYAAGMLKDFFHNTTSTAAKVKFRFSHLDPYADTLTILFSPWGGFLFGAIYYFFREIKSNKDKNGLFLFFVIIAYIGTFMLFFRLKSHRYMLPVMPFVSILIAGWFVKAKRDKSFNIFFEMGGMWAFFTGLMLCIRSYKTENISVNLSDPVNLFHYQQLMLPVFIGLACFSLIFAYMVYTKKEQPLKFVVINSVLFVLILPFYYNALPVYGGVNKSRPLPILGQAVTDRLATICSSKTLVLHRPRFIRTYPDVVYFLKKLDNGETSMYSLGSKQSIDKILKAMANPSKVAEILEKDLPDEKLPLYKFIKNGDFDESVMLLNGAEQQAFQRVMYNLPSDVKSQFEFERLYVLSIKWVPTEIYILHYRRN